MQEKLSILPSKEFLKHFLGLAAATFDVYGLENGDDILEQKFCIVGSAHDAFFFLAIDVKEVKNLQLSSNPFPGTTQKLLIPTKQLRT